VGRRNGLAGEVGMTVVSVAAYNTPYFSGTNKALINSMEKNEMHLMVIIKNFCAGKCSNMGCYNTTAVAFSQHGKLS